MEKKLPKRISFISFASKDCVRRIKNPHNFPDVGYVYVNSGGFTFTWEFLAAEIESKRFKCGKVFKVKLTIEK